MTQIGAIEGGPKNTVFVGELATLLAKPLAYIIGTILVSGVVVGLGAAALGAAGDLPSITGGN